MNNSNHYYTYFSRNILIHQTQSTTFNMKVKSVGPPSPNFSLMKLNIDSHPHTMMSACLEIKVRIVHSCVSAININAKLLLISLPLLGINTILLKDTIFCFSLQISSIHRSLKGALIIYIYHRSVHGIQMVGVGVGVHVKCWCWPCKHV
jgi:hypothetical protein